MSQVLPLDLTVSRRVLFLHLSAGALALVMGLGHTVAVLVRAAGPGLSHGAQSLPGLLLVGAVLVAGAVAMLSSARRRTVLGWAIAAALGQLGILAGITLAYGKAMSIVLPAVVLVDAIVLVGVMWRRSRVIRM
jgi:uncharacterized membrane protein HdeD (DUF308 family)